VAWTYDTLYVLDWGDSHGTHHECAAGQCWTTLDEVCAHHIIRFDTDHGNPMDGQEIGEGLSLP